MKIRFKKKRLRTYLILGVIWLALGTTSIIMNPDNFWSYGFIALGILHLGTYIFENKNQYLKIENGVITKQRLIPKKISLNEIKRIKKFAGDYILTTDSSELRINTHIVEEESLKQLDSLLQGINIKTN